MIDVGLAIVATWPPRPSIELEIIAFATATTDGPAEPPASNPPVVAVAEEPSGEQSTADDDATEPPPAADNDKAHGDRRRFNGRAAAAPNPTKAEIAEACLEIQFGWSVFEEASRRGVDLKKTSWRVQAVRCEAVIEGDAGE